MALRLQRSVVAACIAVTASACSPETDGGVAGPQTGQVTVSISAMTFTSSITSVTVEAQPANVTRTLTAGADSTFTGTLVLPAGTQTLTGRAYAGADLVGSGTTTVTVVAGGTSTAYLQILDTTGPNPPPDASPIIMAFVAPTSVAVGQSVDLSVTAIDPDGDPLTYAWSDDCDTSTFTTPDAAQTSWSNTAAGVCTITLTVTAGGKTVTRTVDVATLAAGEGTVVVQGAYVANPYFTQLYLAGQGVSCYVTPTSEDATCSAQVSPGQTLQLTGYYGLGSGTDVYATTAVDDCGGSATLGWRGQTSGAYHWTAPTSSTACLVSFDVSQDGMSATLRIAVAVIGCPTDGYEQNDSLATSASLGTIYQATTIDGLAADDDDWYSFELATDQSTMTVSVASGVGDDLPLELFDGSSHLLVTSGTNTLTSATEPGAYRTFLLHVGPGAGAASCDSPYSLTIQSP